MSKKMKFDNKEIQEFSDQDMKCFHHVLLSFEDWLKEGDTTGKLNNCKSKLFSDWTEKLIHRGLFIPANDNDRIDLITSQHDYEDRIKREETEEDEEGNLLYDVFDICKLSSKLAKSSCPRRYTRVRRFMKNTAPTVKCDKH